MVNTGTVKFFDATCGFGFIEPDAGGPDIYVHASAVEQAGLRGIAEGQRLIFDLVTDGDTGRSAASFLRRL